MEQIRPDVERGLRLVVVLAHARRAWERARFARIVQACDGNVLQATRVVAELERREQ